MTELTPNGPGQYLTFLLAGEEYGLPILQVREIITYQPITRVPSAPKAIVGVLNLRGAAVPVADLTRTFGLPQRPVTRQTCVVIVDVHHDGELTSVGLLVDSVRQVLELSPEEIRPPPAFGTPVRQEFLRGLGQLAQRFVLLLEAERVLSLEELRGASSLARDASPELLTTSPPREGLVGDVSPGAP